MITFFGIVHADGGCGTEALGAVELLRSRKVPVRMVVPPEDPIINNGNAAADYLRSIDVELLQYEPGMFKDCPVLVSFAEGQRLFPLVKENADRPRYLVYSDCMHFASDDEIGWHKEGLIDEFFFQTATLADRLGPEIARRAQKSVPHRRGYRAFLNTRSAYFPLRFSTVRHETDFTVIKVGRDHGEKWHPDSWRMFCGISAPQKRTVRIEIVGWGPNSANKVGDITDEKNKWFKEMNVVVHTHMDEAKMLAEVYDRAHVMVHVCDYGYEEALGRVFLEAFAAGVVVITDRRGGALELIRHGETGFLVDSPDEAAYYASHLAFNERMRRSIAAQAYAELISTGRGNPDVCWPWWRDLIRKASI